MEIDYLSDVVLAEYYIWENASPELKRKLAGHMIAHGTDTMHNSGAAVAMMHGPDCPFSTLMVCAQKTTQDRYSDAGVNIYLGLEAMTEFHSAQRPNTFVYAGGHAGGAYTAVGALHHDRDWETLL